MNIDKATKDQMLTEVLFNDELFKFVGGDVAADAMETEELRTKIKAFIFQQPEA